MCPACMTRTLALTMRSRVLLLLVVPALMTVSLLQYIHGMRFALNKQLLEVSAAKTYQLLDDGRTQLPTTTKTTLTTVAVTTRRSNDTLLVPFESSFNESVADLSNLTTNVNKRQTCEVQYNYNKNKCIISFSLPPQHADVRNATRTVKILLNSRLVHSWNQVGHGGFVPMVFVNKSCQLIKAATINLNLANADAQLSSFVDTHRPLAIYAGVVFGPVPNPDLFRKIGFSRLSIKYLHSQSIQTFVGREFFTGLTKVTRLRELLYRRVSVNLSWYFGQSFAHDLKDTTYSNVLKAHLDHELGGRWAPSDCQSIQRLAVIIPFRKREQHLWIFLSNMLRFFKQQKVDFTVYVIEQTEPELFNRATLLNVGYLEAKRDANYDCYVFHDVDIVPGDLTNYYLCDDKVRHLMVSRSSEEYRQAGWSHFFGGAMAMTTAQIERINGFPNALYGWGGEDDEIMRRILSVGLKITRYPHEVSHYVTKSHPKDDKNPHIGRTNLATNGEKQRQTDFKVRVEAFRKLDGLSNVKYTILQKAKLALYTHIIVKIPGPVSVQQQKKAITQFKKRLKQEVGS